MNSSIFSFKRNALTFIVIFFVTAIIGTIVLDAITETALARSIPEDEFTESGIQSKIRHYNALPDKANLDAVFIGSSKTLYGISTNILQHEEFKSYNFGLSGAELLNYPDIVDAVIPSHPKRIVINLSVGKLITPDTLEPFKNNGIHSLLYALKTGNLPLIYNTFLGFKKSHDVFRQHGARIRDCFKDFYAAFNPSHAADAVNSFHSPAVFGRTYIDCDIFVYPYKSGEVALCTNGDGMLLRINRRYKKYIFSFSARSDNRLYINYLNQLLRTIEENNITPVIIFEPSINQLDYDLEILKKQIAATHIIDLTNFPIPEDGWADNSHLNVKGRKLYSLEVAKKLHDLKRE